MCIASIYATTEYWLLMMAIFILFDQPALIFPEQAKSIFSLIHTIPAVFKSY
jgi:hypothetical protein